MEVKVVEKCSETELKVQVVTSAASKALSIEAQKTTWTQENPTDHGCWSLSCLWQDVGSFCLYGLWGPVSRAAWAQGSRTNVAGVCKKVRLWFRCPSVWSGMLGRIPILW